MHPAPGFDRCRGPTSCPPCSSCRHSAPEHGRLLDDAVEAEELASVLQLSYLNVCEIHRSAVEKNKERNNLSQIFARFSDRYTFVGDVGMRPLASFS